MGINICKMEGFKLTYSSEDFTTHGTDIGTSNRLFLCCLLSREMEAYQQMILKALNLDNKQKRDTLSNLLGRCLTKTAKKDTLEYLFSWTAFLQGETCSGPMYNLIYSHPEGEMSCCFLVAVLPL